MPAAVHCERRKCTGAEAVRSLAGTNCLHPFALTRAVLDIPPGGQPTPPRSAGSCDRGRGIEAVPSALVLCNQEGISTQVIHCLRLAGIPVHAAGAPEAHFMRWSRYLRSFHRLEARVERLSPDELSAQLLRIVRENNIGVVLGSDYEACRAVASIAPTLPVPVFPTSPPHGIEAYHDKAGFMELARRCGAPIADYVVLPSEHGLDHTELSRRFGRVYVVKPTREGNGNGVTFIDDANTLTQHIIENDSYDFAPLIVMPFIQGRDVGVSIYAENGRVLASVCQQREADSITFFDYPPLVEAASAVVSAGGYTGVAHIDARLGPDGSISLLECNARFWSTVFATALAGINFVQIGLSSLFADKIPCATPPDIAGRSLTPPNRLLARWVGWRGRSLPTTSDSLRWMRIVIGDPLPWILGDLRYRRRRLRDLRYGTRMFGGKATLSGSQSEQGSSLLCMLRSRHRTL